ncbi:MAG TPA: hypothetical protein VFY89_00460 [Ktedonobacterales bacterium]
MRQYEDLLIDALLDYGFTLEEAAHLIALQNRWIDEQRDEEERRCFVRWMSQLWGENTLN